MIWQLYRKCRLLLAVAGALLLLLLSTGQSFAASVPTVSSRSTYHWAGVYAGNGTGPGFTNISGTFNVPCFRNEPINNNPLGSEVRNFVAFGGVYGTHKMFEVGVISSPQVGHYAYWATSDNTASVHKIPGVNPQCGDNVFVYLFYDPRNLPQVTYEVGAGSNYTHGFVSADITYAPDIESIEWITARPACYNSGYSFLADFGAINWRYLYAKLPDAIGLFPVTALDRTIARMVDNRGNTLAASSYPTSNAFTVTWHASGADGTIC